MRRAVVLMLVAFLPASCGHRAVGSGVYVVRSGFSVRGEHVGFGAVVRVRGNRTIRNIQLRISYIANGRRMSLPPETLRFCPPATDCWWGQSFFAQGELSGTRSMEKIDIRVAKTGGSSMTSNELRELRVASAIDHVTVALQRTEGTAYLIAIRDSVPVFGYSFFTTRAEGGANSYSKQVFPHREGDTVRAFLYPGPVPATVYGPTD